MIADSRNLMSDSAHVEVSENRGTPESPLKTGILHYRTIDFGGYRTPICGTPHLVAFLDPRIVFLETADV